MPFWRFGGWSQRARPPSRGGKLDAIATPIKQQDMKLLPLNTFQTYTSSLSTTTSRAEACYRFLLAFTTSLHHNPRMTQHLLLSSALETATRLQYDFSSRPHNKDVCKLRCITFQLPLSFLTRSRQDLCLFSTPDIASRLCDDFSYPPQNKLVSELPHITSQLFPNFLTRSRQDADLRCYEPVHDSH